MVQPCETIKKRHLMVQRLPIGHYFRVDFGLSSIEISISHGVTCVTMSINLTEVYIMITQVHESSQRLSALHDIHRGPLVVVMLGLILRWRLGVCRALECTCKGIE